MCEINYDIITVEECLQMNELSNKSVVINDGKIVGIIEENENDFE